MSLLLLLKSPDAGSSISGTSAVEQANATLSGSGAETFEATSGVTQGAAVAAGSGALLFTAASAATQPAAAIVATGSEVFAATATVTQGPAQLAGAGEEIYSGGSAVTQEVAAISITGTQSSDTICESAVEQPAAVLAGEGSVPIAETEPKGAEGGGGSGKFKLGDFWPFKPGRLDLRTRTATSRIIQVSPVSAGKGFVGEAPIELPKAPELVDFESVPKPVVQPKPKTRARVVKVFIPSILGHGNTTQEEGRIGSTGHNQPNNWGTGHSQTPPPILDGTVYTDGNCGAFCDNLDAFLVFLVEFSA